MATMEVGNGESTGDTMWASLWCWEAENILNYIPNESYMSTRENLTTFKFLELQDLWLGMIGGICLQTIILIILTSITNWKREAEQAESRVKKWGIIGRPLMMYGKVKVHEDYNGQMLVLLSAA
ncbi:hypothetical protein Tsubulata_039050 [Turnera subulata]|uniref:Uncharacterized protein n=1 Tax=Turnera subulata TaxID=218843 RepID=A0A9Q0J808_9ROSI|nr:hypothetical protein Tsubulata_039050 [Turnera subulata]